MSDTTHLKQLRSRELLADALPGAAVVVESRPSGSGWMLRVSWTDGRTAHETVEVLAAAKLGNWSEPSAMPRHDRKVLEVMWLQDRAFVPVAVCLERTVSVTGWVTQRLHAHQERHDASVNPDVFEAAVVLLVSVLEANPAAGVGADECERALTDAGLLLSLS